MKVVRKTTNYDMFKLNPRNRDISDNKVYESIKEKNMLESHPILVDADYYVIDGQHRLAAAKKLQVPIYYIVDENLTEDDIPLLQTQRCWTLSDYAKYYKDTSPTYEFLNKIINTYGLTMTNLIHLFSNSKATDFQRFRRGTYKLNEEDFDNIEKNIELLIIVKKYIVQNKLSRNLTAQALKALWVLINSEEYEHDRFLRQLDRYPDDSLACFRYRDWYNIYDALYALFQKGKRKLSTDYVGNSRQIA